MNILCIGDIVGEPGRAAVKKIVPQLIKAKELGCVIANGENAAGGSGLTPSICDELFGAGVDCITSGDHIWKKREIVDYIQATPGLLRPLNYPRGVPGSGATVITTRSGDKIGVINLMGRVFMEPIENPFTTVLTAVESLRTNVAVIVVDMHAEATSEKIALGYYLDGKVSAVVGTHTHVQTADEKILAHHTAYITDLGMTGPFEGIIGRKKEQILARFITQMPTRFEMAEDNVRLNGAIITVDPKTGSAERIERVDIALTP
ncbi:MAG: TIGR00282 family metallophosphoesterase [Candidatus Omnitrophica bacterium]|nr:TIGR00282 family metallophosphoesterase [Candidatus Omnitrophota bacterium]